MHTLLKILFSLAIIIIYPSCTNNSSQAEKDYIKNLEEKNKSLENELQNEKNKPSIIVERPVEKVFVPQYVPVEKNIVKDFFTIGSSEKEVIEVMGDPSEIIDFESMNEKWLHFGRSYVVLRNDKVKEYHNWEKNLKVKIKNK